MVQLRRGQPGPFPTPEEAAAYPYSPMDRQLIEGHRRLQFIGTAERVSRDLQAFGEKTGASELMIATFTHSHETRARSLELLASAWPAS